MTKIAFFGLARGRRPVPAHTLRPVLHAGGGGPNKDSALRWLRALPLLTLLLASSASAQAYASLDPANPIAFDGRHITYAGRTVELGPRALFLDGRLSDEQTGDYVFNTIQSALDALQNGTEAEPMCLYIAPWVYWVDDPDDPAVRKAVPDPLTGRSTPFGAVIACEWLHFVGLTPDPCNVVLACNRGQTHGAEGNFTMFNIIGDGLMADNVTFGNYCNIDLEFPLAPELNRARRAEAIVQAQLVFSNADKALARNCRFVSRLNLNPIRGARRLLFVDCHFETTDDALAGTGVYLHCDFDIYGSQPFGSVAEDGPVFLDCDIRSHIAGDQYFTKRDGPVALIDTRIHSQRNPDQRIGWSSHPRPEIICYQYNNTLNGRPLDIRQSGKTVDLSGTELLGAYRLEHEGKVIYNTYNLLRGDDDWDPMGVREQVLAAGAKYADIPVFLRVTPSAAAMHTGDDPLEFTATAYRHGLYELPAPSIAWSDRDHGIALSLQPRGRAVDVTALVPLDGRLFATTPDGLEGAAAFRITRPLLPAPKLRAPMEIWWSPYGYANVGYRFDNEEHGDRSIITWYRCSDAQGSNPIAVAISRDEPLQSYTPTVGDVGHWLMAVIEPRSQRSDPGPALTAILEKPIEASDVTRCMLAPDLEHFPCDNQPLIIPGTWTLDGHKPADTDHYGWQPTTDRPNWDYRPGVDGSAGITGLVQVAQGARMLYTPVEGTYGDMTLDLTLVPAKRGGQGFGSATGQYMDLFVKYDTRSQTGYSLRIERTPKFSDRVDFTLMKHENGVSTPIGESISSGAFRGSCYIEIDVKGDKLTASLYSCPDRPGADVLLEERIAENGFGGAGIQHTGTVNANATWIESLNLIYR